MSQVWEVQFPTQSQLLVALKMADYANDQGGSIYPSRNKLAALSQTSESTVKNVLRAFREIGLLIVVREGGHGPKSTTEYEINLRLLNALSSGLCSMVGGSETLQIVWIDKEAEFDPLDPDKGAEDDPSPQIRGQSGPVRGQIERAKGSKALTPIHQDTHQLDSSSAREGDCDAETASPSRSKAEPEITVTPADVSWQAWLDSLSVDDAAAARESGRLFATGRWPGKGRLLSIPRPTIDIAARIIGEGQ